MTTEDMIREYARRGWALTPVRGKRAIRHAWQRTKPEEPDFAAGLLAGHVRDGGGIAVVCGTSRPPLAVSDFDTRAAFDLVLDLLGEWPETPIAQTTRGLHVYWQDPGGLSPQVGDDAHDLKVGGGYLVLPPDPAAPARQWVRGRAPWEVDVASMPTALLRLYADRQGGLSRHVDHPATQPHEPRFAAGRLWTRYGEAAMTSELDRLLTARHPGRNRALFKAAANLGELVVGGHLDRGAVERGLRRAAEVIYASGPPPEPGEIEATIRSGLDPSKRRARGPSEATA